MLKAQIAANFTGLLTSQWLRDQRRRLAEIGRRLRGAPFEVHYFHQVDDPYSQLAASMLPALAAAFEIDLVPHLVGPPPDAAAPEREKLAAYARKDAADIAPAYGLSFARHDHPAAPSLVAQATAILAAAKREQFIEHAAAVGDAVWVGDESRLRALAAVVLPTTDSAAIAAVAEGTRLRAKLGHYLGAMFYCQPEWYWGVDRLHYLGERLGALGRVRAGSAAAIPQPRDLWPPSPSPRDVALQLEFYPSLRSPYTAISMRRVSALGERYPLEIVIKPVLPMVMRGLPVPLNKRMYIVLDTKREADRAGIPFGRICDPVGAPVERGFSLWRWAREQGRGAAYLQAFAESVFAAGIDAGTDAGLRRIVETSGLSWDAAQQHRHDEGWREELEANRRELFDLGLWGVPSFRLIGGVGEPDFCTWGQDRIWLVEQEIRRRLG